MEEAAMDEAGKEEKQLAEERNQYHEGIPAITVIVDVGCRISILTMPTLVWGFSSWQVAFHWSVE